MKCPRCEYDNPPHSSFCLECGGRLTLTCGACGAALPSGSRFCNHCGTPVDPSVWEFTRSHRAHGWLVLEGGSVSYGRATPYLPVIELLKAYLRIQERDDQREMRERVQASS